MRILADENIPRAVVAALTETGHDVRGIGDESGGADDLDVLRAAVRERRVLLTADKDFGGLVRRSKRPTAVILLRARMSPPDRLASLVVSVVSTRDDWEGLFAVITDATLRVRRMTPNSDQAV
ncbi:MAG: DUF5615 family PIN-like protein [Actinomycetota bacterium]